MEDNSDLLNRTNVDLSIDTVENEISKVRRWRKKSIKERDGKKYLNVFHWVPIDVKRIQNNKPPQQTKKIIYPPNIPEILYKNYFESENWNIQMTNYLLELAQKFELNFFIIHDEFCMQFADSNFTVLDLRRRYHDVCEIFYKCTNGSVDPTIFEFEYENELKRNRLLEKYHRQTHEEIERELYLENELEKRYKQKPETSTEESEPDEILSFDNKSDITQTEYSKENLSTKSFDNGNSLQTIRSNPNPAPQKKMRAHQKRMPSISEHKPVSIINPITKILSTHNRIYHLYKFPDLKSVGTSLRSQRLKVPQNIGARRIKALNHALIQMNYIVTLPATVEICDLFSTLRSNLIALYDLKHALICLEMEYQKLRTKFHLLNPNEPNPFKDEDFKSFKVTLIDDPPINKQNLDSTT